MGKGGQVVGREGGLTPSSRPTFHKFRYRNAPRCRIRVRTDKTQSEHNESGVHLLADIGAEVGLRRDGPTTDFTHRSKQPPYSITSSARASTVGGTSRPSALAVFRLITSSYFVGACTGRLAGFSPLRMRST